MRKTVVASLIFLLSITILVSAQDRIDQEYTRLIRDYTTDDQFITPLVDHLPLSDSVPSPLKFLGYISGTPGKQTYYKDIVRYYRALASTSNRVAVFDVGKSHQGKVMIVVAISDALTITDIDTYKGYTRELADPRTLNKERKSEILSKAKPFYLFTGGLHTPETGSPEMLMEMAYRLAVSETDLIRRIRSNVITLIVPVLEIDGWDRQVDWYYRHTKKIEKWEDLPKSSSPYWGDYTLHDNNRDGIMVSQPLTENINKVFFSFHPQITHDLHESVPLLYVSTGTGPYYSSLDPITIDEWQWFAFNEVTQMTKFGVPGVWTWGFYTGWYPGYVLWIGNNHNAIGRFYETFGNAGANTFERDIQFGRRGGITEREWYRASPPPKKVKWSLRNNNNLMQSSCLIALDFTARHSDSILENFIIKGENAIRAGGSEKPYAWIVPEEQQDLRTARILLDVLGKHQIELHRLSEDFTAGEETYPAGSLVIRMDQPYRTLAKSLLEIQNWPENNNTRPYDATAWTLGLMLNVTIKPIENKEILSADMVPYSGGMFEGGLTTDRSASHILIPPQGTGMISALVALEDVEVRIAEEEFTAGEKTYPAGTWILPNSARSKVDRICKEIGMRAEEIHMTQLPQSHPVVLPRLAMYLPWFSTQDPGWYRYTLDAAGIPWTAIDKDIVKKGKLNEEFDVIVIPHSGGFASGLNFLRGINDRHGPLAYTETAEYIYSGKPFSSPDITGGLGFDGLRELENFVQSGGTLITCGSGSRLVTDFGLLKGVSSQNSDGLVCPGTIVTGTVKQKKHPAVYGYDEHPAIYRSSTPLFNVAKYMRKYVVAQFGTKLPPDEEEEQNEMAASEQPGTEASESKKPAAKIPLLKSGLLRGGSALDGSLAILDAPAGKGRIVMITFNPMYRWMNHTNFSFLHNAIMNWNAPSELREIPENQ